MQEAIPYRRGRATWPSINVSSPLSSDGGGTHERGTMILRARVAENPVVVAGRRGCCMCHVVKLLLLGLGVNPAMCEVREETEYLLVKELGEIEYRPSSTVRIKQDDPQQPVLLPAVFIGGRLVGGLDQLMAIHISGDLVPLLKVAGALWL